VACDAPTACFEVETATHDKVGVNVRKQTQESRQKSDLGKQLRGETAEVLLALKTVSALLGSGITEERKTALWSELLTNWQKINFTDQAHRDELSATMPQDPKELLDQLHVAKRLGDGLGFDIISYVEEGDGLLAMVEVKDIGADRIFLSENERLLAVELTKLKVPWRLYGYVQGAGWQDLTKLITDHATEAGTHVLSLGLRPKEWELKLKRKQ
jgi:hypothetical protein